MKVITIGGATRDIFIVPKETSIHTSATKGNSLSMLSVPGEKVEIESIYEDTGGGATNAAVAFSRLGMNVSCLCKIGTDDHGIRITETLKADNVNIDLIKIDKKFATGTSYIIHPIGGKHIIFTYRSSNTNLKETEIPYESIKTSNFLYITTMSKDSSKYLLPICLFAKQNNIPVAINPGRSQLKNDPEYLKNILSSLHILILNIDEASLLLNSLEKQSSQQEFSTQKFFVVIHKLGVSICVVTAGAHGAYVSDGKRILFSPSLDAKVVDTVGAGDSFGSTFTTFIMMKMPLEEALKRALLSSQSVIEHLGAKRGLLTTKEIDAKANKTSLNKLLVTRLNIT